MCKMTRAVKKCFLACLTAIGRCNWIWTAFVSSSGFGTWTWCHLRQLGRKILREVSISLRRMAESRGFFFFAPLPFEHEALTVVVSLVCEEFLH